MILSKFEVSFFQKLDKFFKPHGFDLLIDQKQFRKTTQNGFQNIIFSVVESEKDFFVDVNFGIRNNQIEEIAQQFLTNRKSYQKQANTLVISIGKYKDLKGFRFKIVDDEDLEEILDSVRLFFEDDGIGFLNKITYLAKIDEILNDAPLEPCKYVFNQTHRCFKGLIAAKLIDNHTFHSLANIYRKHLIINATDEDLINFERLIAFLLYYNPN